MLKFMKSALAGASLLALGAAASAQEAQILNAEQLDTSGSVVATAAQVQNFSTLVAAVEAAGLAEALMGEGPYTVFAPIDSAFEALPAGTVDTLLLPENRDQLASLLQGHVVPGRYSSDDLNQALLSGGPANVADETLSVDGTVISLDTLTLSTLSVEKRGDSFYVTGNDTVQDNARIIAADIPSANGVIHVIDTVLSPAAEL